MEKLRQKEDNFSEKSPEERKCRLKCLNALQLKVLAMALMLCDHMWGTIAVEHLWLTAIGRLAFPIFAFQLVEGFYLTHDRKTYLKRMFFFALVSELPFNLMTEGGLFNPFHQNVMFTFCLSLLAMSFLERARKKGRVVFALALAGTFGVGYFVGFLTFVDYFGYGIWMALVFYLFRNVKWGWVGQLAGMVYINWGIIGGLVYLVPLFGRTIEIPEQGLAVLALIPIWLYNGKQGPHSRAIQYACYGFYPVHMLILGLLAKF